jgi:hypothetical protein
MDKRKFTVYLAGAYSGAIDMNIQTARETAIKVWESGFTCLCPHLNTANFQIDCKCQYTDYLEGDLALLENCQAVLMLPNWITSSGATQEKEFATLNKIPVFHNLKEIEIYYQTL